MHRTRAARCLLVPGSVPPDRMREAHPGQARVDVRVDDVEAGTGELVLGIAELRAGRASVLVEREAHAMALLGGGSASARGGEGNVHLLERTEAVDDLGAELVGERLPLRDGLALLRLRRAGRWSAGERVVR